MVTQKEPLEQVFSILKVWGFVQRASLEMTMMMRGLFILHILCLAVVLPVYAEASMTTGALRASNEEWALPGHERIGMVELGVAYDFTDNVTLGIGSWMAVKGERGGFITLGLDGNVHYPINETIDLNTGLYMGAGLVWQANAGVGYDITPSLSALATLGRMEAVNGDFKANVIGIAIAWQFQLYFQDIVD